MDEKQMSKYARKQLARARAREQGTAAIAVAFARVDAGLPPPKPKPKNPPPPPRSALNDLGERPTKAAKMLAEAVANMQDAEKLLQECYDLGNPGVQRGEALAILGCLRAALPRIEGIATRAAHIPNNAPCDRCEEVEA